MLQHQAAFPEPFHDAARVQLGKPGRGQVGGDDEGPAVGMTLEDDLLQLAADKIRMMPFRPQVIQHQYRHTAQLLHGTAVFVLVALFQHHQPVQHAHHQLKPGLDAVGKGFQHDAAGEGGLQGAAGAGENQPRAQVAAFFDVGKVAAYPHLRIFQCFRQPPPDDVLHGGVLKQPRNAGLGQSLLAKEFLLDRFPVKPCLFRHGSLQVSGIAFLCGI